MKKMNYSRVLSVAVLVSIGGQAFAQSRLRTSCHMDPTGAVKGSNVDSLVEIASVSKLITSQWAVEKLGARYRYQTLVHVTPVSQGVVDIHLEGGMDPSFNASRLALLIAELNIKGVTQIRELTYDQNFRYRNSIYTGPVIASNPANFILGPNGTMAELRRAVTSIGTHYAEVRTQLRNRINSIDLPATVRISVGNIESKNKESFSRAESTQSFISRSIELHKILKEMNIVSNNYLANLVFSHLGGSQAYADFASSQLSLDNSKIRMSNGSGYPDYSSGSRVDNKATCRSVVTIARSLREALNRDSMVFADVVAMAGVEGRATVSKVYNSERISNAVAAKTGTSDPVVSLAGLASTQEGIVYFGVVVSDGRPGRAASGREIIRTELLNVVRAYGGKKGLQVSPSTLFPADNGSLMSAAQGSETLK